MATNEEKRRAIGTNNEAARRAIGTNNEAARRKIGSDMIERRTGRAQVDDINALLNPPRERRTLKQLEPRGGVTGQVGTGNYTAPPATGTGGGISSPLSEVPGSREYHTASVVIRSVDGSTYMAVQVPSRIKMTDSTGAEVIFEYRNVV